MQKIKSFLTKIYKRVLRYYYFGNLKEWLADCDSVLDLGCGSDSPLKLVKNVRNKVCVEAFEPYILKSKKSGIHDKYIKSNIAEVDFPDRSFDAVIILDVLEHMEKEQALEMINKIKKWARKRVILSTPNGHMPQEEIHNNPLQKHICSFSVDELEKMGFKVYGFNGLKFLRKKVLEDNRLSIFWKIFADITQIYIYFMHKPKLAFNLCAVLELDKGNESK